MRSFSSSFLRRLTNVLDALTQLGNAALLPRPFDTNANESISGRCYREAILEKQGGLWLVSMSTINWVFELTGEQDHCYNAYLSDLSRGRDYQERHSRYTGE